MCKRILLSVFLLLFSVAVWSQEQPATTDLWNQAFAELDNLNQNSQQLQNIIESLKQDSTKQQALLDQATAASKSLGISLQFSEIQNKWLKVGLVVLGVIVVGETSYIVFR